MLDTLALWMELIGKESFIFSQGSLVNCFSPREILDFSLSKLVTLKSSLSPTLRTSEGWFILYQVISVICNIPSTPPRPTKAP